MGGRGYGIAGTQLETRIQGHTHCDPDVMSAISGGWQVLWVVVVVGVLPGCLPARSGCTELHALRGAALHWIGGQYGMGQRG